MHGKIYISSIINTIERSQIKELDKFMNKYPMFILALIASRLDVVLIEVNEAFNNNDISQDMYDMLTGLVPDWQKIEANLSTKGKLKT